MLIVGAALLLCLCVAACVSIGRAATCAQRLSKVLLAGTGDVVLRIEREINRGNAVGDADALGRKAKEGFSEIRFVGVEPSGEIIFYRDDMAIACNETTSGNNTVAIRLAAGEYRLPVSGYVIEVLAADANSIEYRISQPAL